MNNDLQLGKIAEYQFIVDASKRSLSPSIPVCDNRGYDFIIHGKSKLYKIQVKSTRTISKIPNGKTGAPFYKIGVCCGRDSKKTYSKEHLDFFAIYIFDLNQWFIVPLGVVTSKTLRIYPNNNLHKYSKYREAWHLIK